MSCLIQYSLSFFPPYSLPLSLSHSPPFPFLLSPLSPVSRVTYDSCNTLTITSVEEGDRGSYFCKADNDDTDQAEDTSEIIELEYCSKCSSPLTLPPSLLPSLPPSLFPSLPPLFLSPSFSFSPSLSLSPLFLSPLSPSLSLFPSLPLYLPPSLPPSFLTLLSSLCMCTVEPKIAGDLTFSKNNPDEGEDTIATYEWTGSPTPEVTWLKDGVPLVEGELPSRIRITLTNNDLLSELQIHDVELDDAGHYTCNVSNPVGSDYQIKTLEVCIITRLHNSKFV